jgi:hypothetical protein
MFRAVALIVVLFTTWESIKAQGLAQDKVPSWEKKTPVWENDKCHAPNLGGIRRIEKSLAVYSYQACPK